MKNCHVFIQDYKRLHGLLIRTLVTPLFACYRKSIATNRKIYLFVGGRGYRAGSRFHVEGEGTMSRVEGRGYLFFPFFLINKKMSGVLLEGQGGQHDDSGTTS